MTTNFVKEWQTPLICRFGIPKRNWISLPQSALSNANDASTSCKNFVNFPWSSNSTIDTTHLWTSGTTRPKKLAYFVEYLRIFAIFSSHESALGADDRSVPYFPICQGTSPWHSNFNLWVDLITISTLSDVIQTLVLITLLNVVTEYEQWHFNRRFSTWTHFLSRSCEWLWPYAWYVIPYFVLETRAQVQINHASNGDNKEVNPKLLFQSESVR